MNCVNAFSTLLRPHKIVSQPAMLAGAANARELHTTASIIQLIAMVL
jgi:hypothetical protein